MLYKVVAVTTNSNGNTWAWHYTKMWANYYTNMYVAKTHYRDPKIAIFYMEKHQNTPLRKAISKVV